MRMQMTNRTLANLTIVALFGTALIAAPSLVMGQQQRFDALANSPTFENRPTEESSRLLMDE